MGFYRLLGVSRNQSIGGIQKINKPIIVSLLLIFALLTVSRASAYTIVQRDSDSDPPVSDPGHPTTGTRFSMYQGFAVNSCGFDQFGAPGAITWPANSAFYVRHGYVFPVDPTTTDPELFAAFMRPTTHFELYVDNVEQQSYPLQYSAAPHFFINFNLINFPNGMTGTHLIQGWWFVDGYIDGLTPNTSVFDLACNLQVTFV